ncbi:hypothetical protein HGRIS_007067 [Hohenbuehelia grisea]|uniref:Glucose-methanol-choline oxidoreductase N-terminal domain-containing protein n=1 Tax=Hohenbuehelia grisea TaxID=104357 RepID=A0ABR3JB82_9AGAR
MSATLQEITEFVFDYVVIGGGTAGLTLAARLSENPSISVAVLEVGQENFDEPKILIPGQFGATFGDPKFDWVFKTTKQQHSDDKSYMWSRGKGLGGSSAMNFCAWSKPPAFDIDAFEKLGNPGWNWESYHSYSKRSERFHPAIEEFAANKQNAFDPVSSGTSGPIQVTVPFFYDTLEALFQKTLANVGIDRNDDPYGGDINGAWTPISNYDPQTWTRSYATTGYYLPNQARENLKILTGALVSRIILDETEDELQSASGVEFIHNGATHTVRVKKEVVVCAGAIKSPQILELSGIGRKDILKRIGVDLKVNLPGVGENVQEHHFSSMSFELDPTAGHTTRDLLRNPLYAAEALKLHAEGKGPLRAGPGTAAFVPLSATTDEASTIIENIARQVEDMKCKGGLAPGLAEQWDNPTCSFEGRLGSRHGVYTLSPFYDENFGARGRQGLRDDYLRYQSSLLEGHHHLEILVQHMKFVRKLAATEPWKSDIVREVDPGLEVTTDEQMREYIKKYHSTAWHTVGSCSMLPRDKQGVVDPSLKVYGTSNVRVADLSIVPLHIAAHTQATAYMIGEKGTI